MSNQPRNLVLSIQLGPWKGRDFNIPPGQIFSVGRRKPANIEIEVDDFMSGVHFDVENQGQTAWIRDRGSRNKTFVNSQIITSIELQDGDEIRAGKTVFRIFWESAPLEPPRVHEPQPEVFPSFDETPTPYPPHQPFIPPPSIPFAPFIDDSDAPEEFEPPTPSREAIEEEVDGEIDYSLFDNYSRKDSDSGVPENDALAKPRDSFERFPGEAGFKKTQSLLASSNMSKEWGVQSLSLYQSPINSFSLLLESLVDVAEFMVVPHFRKLGVNIDVGMEEISLFPDLPGASQYLPVGVMGRNWVRGFNQKWTQRLVQNDGIVVLLGEECIDIANRLSRGAVDGFSLSNGFLGWYWPSQLMHMRSRMSKESLSEWIGEDWMALVYPDVEQSIISGFAKGQAGIILEKLGFELY